MSEIKGQILGIVLVLAIFGVVASVIATAFKKSADNIASSIAAEPTVIIVSSRNNNLPSYLEF